MKQNQRYNGQQKNHRGGNVMEAMQVVNRQPYSVGVSHPEVMNLGLGEAMGQNRRNAEGEVPPVIYVDRGGVLGRWMMCGFMAVAVVFVLLTAVSLINLWHPAWCPTYPWEFAAKKLLPVVQEKMGHDLPK